MSNAEQSTPGLSADRFARLAGALLIVTAVVSVVMVYARVSADTDQPTLLQFLEAVRENRLMYGISGFSRLISGITLSVAGLLLLRTWIIGGGWATRLVPYLFVVSGVFTTASGACAVLTSIHPVLETVPDLNSLSTTDLTVLETMSDFRWISGKIGFAMAGIALIVAARYQWRVGSTLRRISPLTGTLGVAMQFIWIDAATIMHPVVGTAFIVWLVAIGFMLASGRVEQHFKAAYGDVL